MRIFYIFDSNAQNFSFELIKGLETTKNLIKDAGGKCFAYWVDVSSREDVYGVAKKVEAEVGKVDILINNAGVVEGQFLLDVVDDRIERMFKINILAHYWVKSWELLDLSRFQLDVSSHNFCRRQRHSYLV